MQRLAKIENYDNYCRILPVEVLDKFQVNKAKKCFEEYKENGVIKDGDFNNDVWTLTNQILERKLRFDIEPDEYKSGAGSWIGISRRQFREAAKTYICLSFGESNISHLVSIANQLRALGTLKVNECNGFTGDIIHVISFLKLLPGESVKRDVVIEKIEDEYQMLRWNKSNARRLSDFKNYLLFDRKIKEFWENANSDKRIMYFPVYFWWTLTAILPLRATEFLLTPYDCIKKTENGYVITIRRTKLKKKRNVTYKIESDYEMHDYTIPDDLAKNVLEYQAMTALRKREMLLLSSIYARSRYLSYGQFNNRLNGLLKEIDSVGLGIHMGDTRHIAMINLILSGGSPTICRELAGHENISISSNYYANLSEIIECSVYDFCTRTEQGADLSGNMYFSLELPKEKIRVQDGWCNCMKVETGDISECMKNYRTGSTLGNCSGCVHYIPDKKGMKFKITKERKQAVDDSCEYLIQTIELVRKGNGADDDILTALSKLQNDSFRYAATLILGKGE